ncbi:ubiquitin carboxyl-terminal hydrolase 26 [Cornus florida]|uniref:ubiquitin carboxyl-terminal hydrolase 26 n=1 Tax=Cornus florida TaxID=4283 RepID=UPI0028A1FB52|nr:ubiquitin carboxyl-terminal hydrolase 26 [Cornus florida]XP_059653832.1 ubiquitin carboxyl-terminal hydrolase 26 [Cornus florida]XP_059653833.1 ubiquitin carboxyl-terminal hydrolase 26 [Cornus florida]
MSHRPTTRSKNKRHKVDDNARNTSLVFRKIHSVGQVTVDDVNQLYMIWKPVCQGCRVNTKDNPNCFCGLVPPLNGVRKSGLWQKTSEIILSLGPDVSSDLRSSTNSPAGLTNLGATCYANSILQCLYMNKSFREGVFSVEPEVLKEQPVLHQLARLFAQLHSSKMAFVDSAPFIKTLELDNGIQQDSHEFLTLLFSLLERCLSCSKVSKAKTIIQDLFCGKVSHVTTCSRCGKDSEASSKTEDFYGLELNIKGLKSLDDSLDDYLSVEELQGDNQYYCESCDIRVDATRSIKLRSLPAVLNFQLKRCVFVPKSTTKKKITSPFCFPGKLDMRHRLSEHSESDVIYDLSAVLIHKGTAVNSGHYIAHIKDENTDQWWKFDDEYVSNLGQHPFGEGASNSVAKPVQTEAIARSSSSEPMDAVVIENHVDVSLSKSSEANVLSHVETFSSSDAYMLMYVLRCSKNDGEKPHMESGGNNMEKKGDIVSPQSDVSLPSHLSEELKQLNASYLDACQLYKTKKESELNRITERRQEVRSVISEAPVQSLGEPYYWISTDWLRQWADSISPSIIDNTPVQCLHGKVPVSKIGSMKRLSSKAWNMLFSKYDGGPTLAMDDYCVDCLLEGAHTMVSADSYKDRRKLMVELAVAVVAGKCLDGTLYYVSKTWLHQWLRRKNTDSPCEADAGPTASIRCPHGELLPEEAMGARRLLVPESLWLFIYEIANEVKPDDLLGCSTFRSDSETCVQCTVELTEVACNDYNIRELKLKQRQNHEKLAAGKSIALYPHCKYFLLPSSWLSTWRTYINASGRNSSLCVEPESLNGVIDLLKCEKHSKLVERPPDLIWKRNMILQRSSTIDALTIITENDWELFCKDWGGTEEKGVSAEIEFGVSDNLVGSCEKKAISVENLNSHDEENGEVETRRPLFKTFPEICEDCIGERESSELMRKLNYCNEDIFILFVRGKEPPRSVIEGCRISKRSRKTSFGDSINLNVSGSTSIYQLKMMIWESFGVVKENQILHKGSSIIEGESATLADMNIFPGDTLWVTDSEIHENRDIAEELSDQKMEVQQAEEGFRGTLLTSNISSQIISDECYR